MYIFSDCHISSEDRSILEDSLSENTYTIQLYVQSGHSRQKQQFSISRVNIQK
jgi:hypothetical protein